jgi:hypothetical protein
MTQKLKFSLSVQINHVDSEIVYTVSPGARSWQDQGLDWYEWEYDPTKTLMVQVDMVKPPGTQSHIIISNLAVNGIEIGQFNQTGTYIRSDTNQIVKNTYGYMSWTGKYIFKIRYSPLVHNYITYLYNLATS